MSAAESPNMQSEGLTLIRLVESLLDRNEIFSLVFLLFESIEVALEELHLEVLRNRKASAHWPVTDSSLFRPGLNQCEGLLVQWFRSSPKSWRKKLEEALLIIKNYQCLKVIGKNKNDGAMKFYFAHRFDFSVKIDTVRKFLFMMVDDLTESQWALLMKYLRDESVSVKRMCFPTFPPGTEIPAEYYVLFFISRGLITLRKEDTKMNFKALSRSLKSIGNLEWANRVTDFEDLINNEKKYSCVSNFARESSYSPIPSFQPKQFHLDPSYPGFALIINQVMFNGQTGRDGNTLSDRLGSDKDTSRLKQTFKLLGFECKVESNITAAEMHEHIKKSLEVFCKANIKHSERCFVLVVLSHGDESGVYGIDGKLVYGEEILNMLRNRQLEGMPRLLIYQACKGKSQVAVVNGQSYVVCTDQTGSCLTDLLIYSSCVNGFAAYRSPSQGSFFIYFFCKVILSSGASTDFLTLTHVINDKLASYEIFMNNMPVKMAPEIQGTFTKKLYLSVPLAKQTEANTLVRKWQEESSFPKQLREQSCVKQNTSNKNNSEESESEEDNQVDSDEGSVEDSGDDNEDFKKGKVDNKEDEMFNSIVSSLQAQFGK